MQHQDTATTGTTSTEPHPLRSALSGLTTLGVLLQGLWGGTALLLGPAVWLPTAARLR